MPQQRRCRSLVDCRRPIPDGSDDTADPLLPPQLSRALADVQLEITRLKTEKENIEKSIESYQTRVDNGFTREQQLLTLSRDYQVTQKNYQTMLDKKLEAQLSQSLERRQKGERFRLLDPASLPQAPAAENTLSF